MKTPSSRLFIEDIHQAMEKIERYIKGLTFEMFAENEMAVDAVLRNLEIIGEAARNIPENLRTRYAKIPWKRMVGLRHIVAHRYFNVDLDIVWQIITENLPETKSEILVIMKALDKDSIYDLC